MYTRLFKDELSSFLTVSERANGKKKNQELKMVNQQVGHEFHIPVMPSPVSPIQFLWYLDNFQTKENSFQKQKIFFIDSKLNKFISSCN